MQPTTLGRYQLLKLLAKGGMAEIFAARVTGLSGFQKIVVVKRMLPTLACDEESVTMFLDEARIAATLHHPNIVQVYDFGSDDGQYFMSMEYLHGQDVRSLLKALRARKERLPLEHALHIISALTAGLHSAHEKVGFDGKPLGVVHRDVTPQNIFINYDGSVKIVDFGIAKAVNAQSKTQHGMIKGKVGYMSPEQCRRQRLDRRSDIYAAGIILYELTTGLRLYKETDRVETLRKIVEEPVPPPSSVMPRYPAELERVVMGALAKDKNERYQTAQAMQADLEGFARARRLEVSAIAMAQFMEKIFGHHVEAWPEAEAAATPVVGLDDARSVSDMDLAAVSTPALRNDTEVDVIWEAGEAIVEGVGEAIAEESGRPTAGEAGRGLAPETVHATAELPALAGVPVPWLDLLVVAVVTCMLVLIENEPEAGPMGATAAAQVVMPSSAKPTPEPLAVVVPIGVSEESSAPSGAVTPVAKTGSTATPAIAAEIRAQEAKDVGGALAPQRRRHPAKKHSADPPESAVVPDPRTDGDGDGDGDSHRDVDGDVDGSGGQRSPPEPNLETGELRVGAEVSCEVIVADETRGFTPIVLKLQPGQYTLRCLNTRFGMDSSRRVEIQPGQVTKERF